MGVGVVVQCENGYVLVPNYVSCDAYDRQGKPVKHWETSHDALKAHQDNWLSAVAAPVFDEKGNVAAALSVSGPTLRLTPKRIAELRPLVIKQCRALSKQLGHRPEGVHAA